MAESFTGILDVSFDSEKSDFSAYDHDYAVMPYPFIQHIAEGESPMFIATDSESLLPPSILNIPNTTGRSQYVLRWGRPGTSDGPI